MSNKVCLVTGATAGLGIVTARVLAQQGALVVVVGRNPDRCAAASRQIRDETGSLAVDWLAADLSSQRDVRRLAMEFNDRYDRLDVLVNNAGAIFARRCESVDRIEMTFALNHLAYFFLTQLLLETIKASAPARIVNVSSVAHAPAQIDFADLQARRGYRGFRVYARSKLANILFTYELARRLAGTDVIVNAVNPGLVKTRFGANNGWLGWLGARLVHLLYHRHSVSPEQGARTILYAATSPEIQGVTGRYFSQCREVPSSAASRSLESSALLWEASAQLTGLAAPVDQALLRSQPGV